MGSEAPPSPASRRPGAGYFILVIALVAVGVLAPQAVRCYERRTERAVPIDTTGNRPDSAPPAPLRTAAPQSPPSQP
jgi:hypothetical protein